MISSSSLDKKVLSDKLIRLLSKVNFDSRYYEYYESCKDRSSGIKMKPDVLAPLLETQGLDFEYNKKEKFYSHKEDHEQFTLVFNIALLQSSLEMLLYLNVGSETVGGPFPRLARQVAVLSRPDFKYAPASPKIPIESLDDASQAINFGVSLFEDARQSILSEVWS